MSKPPVRVLNIFSSRYAGSTWLSLMLGAHSQAFCIGEATAILRLGKAYCTVHGDQCPVWSRYDGRSEENFFLQVARLTGRRLLVLSSSRKFLDAQDHPKVESSFLHLVRDGRAVTASILRKDKGYATWQAARLWRREVRRAETVAKRFATDQRHLMHYESLAADPVAEVRSLCDFLKIDFEPGMLNYWEHPMHYLGGNRGTLFATAKKQGADLAQQPVDPSAAAGNAPRVQWDLDFYNRQSQPTIRDERWRRELSPWQLRLFSFFAGRTNRRYGYPSGLETPQTEAPPPQAALPDESRGTPEIEASGDTTTSRDKP